MRAPLRDRCGGRARRRKLTVRPKGKAKVGLDVTFTPSGGDGPKTQTESVKLVERR